MTSTPLYLTSHPLYLTLGSLYLCHHTHSINDITANICMISHPVYMWHNIHYIYDIIPTMYNITILCVDDTTLGMCMTSFELQKTSHPLYHTKPQYLFVTSTSGMTSHPLYQTSHSLYLCHHYLSTDITPSFVWHQTHYIYDIICTIFNITFTPYVITLLYLLHHNIYVFNYIQYIGQHIHYLCDVTATNLCHHTHCIDIIRPILCMTSHSA